MHFSKIHQRFAARAAAVAAVARIGLVGAAGSASADVDASQDATTASGYQVNASLSDSDYNSVASLATNVFTKDVFTSGLATATINGSSSNKITKANLEFGYQIGVQVDVSAGITLSPSVSLSLPISATGAVGITPGVGLGFGVPLKAGGITEVPVQKKDFTGTKAAISLTNYHFQVNGVLGQVTVRPYVKLVTSTSYSDDVVVAYGDVFII